MSDKPTYLCELMNGRKQLGRYVEKEHCLIQVSGYNMEKLIELFAAGYTLKPPDQRDLSKRLSDLI